MYTVYTVYMATQIHCTVSTQRHSSSFLSFHNTCFAPTQLPISSFRIWLTLSLAIRSSCWRPEWIAIEGKLHSTSLAQARSQGPIATNRTRSSTNSTNGSSKVSIRLQIQGSWHGIAIAIDCHRSTRAGPPDQQLVEGNGTLHRLHKDHHLADGRSRQGGEGGWLSLRY